MPVHQRRKPPVTCVYYLCIVNLHHQGFPLLVHFDPENGGKTSLHNLSSVFSRIHSSGPALHDP